MLKNNFSIWFSVNQLIFYHSVLQLHKVMFSGSPMHLYTRHNSWSYSYRIRQAETGLVQLMGNLKIYATRKDLKWRAANQYNKLPGEIRNCSSTKSYKMQDKTWIRINVL